jgi:haloalkane dehalogenase
MYDYTITRHQKWVEEALFQKLALNNAHFILHDWGGIIGLRAIANHQNQVAGIIMSNTGFPVRDPEEPITKMARPGARPMRLFQLYVRFKKNWQHWNFMTRFLKSEVQPSSVAGFAAPYPDKNYLTGNRQFTQMLPTRNDNPTLIENWHALEKLKQFKKPFLCLYSDQDQVAPNGYQSVRTDIPGAAAIEPVILEGGGHFLLEDIPDAYSQEVLKFLDNICKQTGDPV